MKICYISPHKWLDPIGEWLADMGHEVSSDCGKDTDLILGMSVTKMGHIQQAMDFNPKALVVNYNWDIYNWVWDKPRDKEWDYKAYVEMLKASDLVLVPSLAEARRSAGLGINNVQIQHCPIPYYDMPPEKITKGNYIMCALRGLPDEYDNWFELACGELGLPYFRPRNHELSDEEFREKVAGCRFVVNHYHEASTGGLTVMEGLYLGKPCLVTDDPENGGLEYASGFAKTYKHGNYPDFKQKLMHMYLDTPKIDREKAQKYVADNFSYKQITREINTKIEELYHEKK